MRPFLLQRPVRAANSVRLTRSLVLAATLLVIGLSSLVRAEPRPDRVQLRPRAPTPTPMPQPHIGNDREFKELEDYYIKARQIPDYDEVVTATTSELPTGAISVDGQPLPTTSYSHDPLLALMPDFAFSMPAQIVVTGINLALVAVLVTHLLFTVQYHFPLSRKNYNLQISSSVMLLISLSVTLHIILSQLETKSQSWPYMFPYIGVQVPPGDNSWTVVQEVFYLLMRAITTALIHITHIQFLTLLFPSALEARLILWMLGPLAIVNSGMEFTALSADDDFKTSDLGDAIRNICNSTLTLLYTSALLIWGLLVNRRRAWRKGGGTAAFGGGSVGLALINTAISFTEIKFDRLWWLPNVCWTLTIWQSWLGFWWWVSSGMGIGEVEDRQERLEKKRKRELRRRRKAERQRKKAAGIATDNEDDGGAEKHADNETSSIPGLNGIRRFKERMMGENSASTAKRRHRRAAAGARRDNDQQDPEHIELRQVRIASDAEEMPRGEVENPGAPGLDGVSVVREGHDDDDDERQGREDGGLADDARTTAGTGSGSSDTNPTTAASSAPAGWLGLAAQKLMENQPKFIKARFRRLRLAHVAAARRAATEQSAIRDQVLNSSRNTGPGLRHMMFDRSSSVRAGLDPSDSAAAGSSRRNSAALRSAPDGARLTDEDGQIGRRWSRNAALPDEGSSLGGQEGSAEGGGGGGGTGVASSAEPDAIGGNSHLHIVRPSSADRSISNDTSTTRVSPRTPLSASGDSFPRMATSSSDHVHVLNEDQHARPPLGTSMRSASSGTDQSPVNSASRTIAITGASRPAAPIDSLAGDDEWIDEDPTATETPRIRRRRAPQEEQIEAGSMARRPGERQGESEGRGGSEEPETGRGAADDTSWYWRGGLRQMRLRDRTRYD